MTDRALVRALETRLVNAWPSFEIEIAEGWLLRFAEGYSKRANAATPLFDSAGVDEDLFGRILAAFEARGIAPCFRLTGIEDPEAEGFLDRAGLVAFDPSQVMMSDLDGIEPAGDAEVRIRPEPEPDWIDASAASYGGEKSNAALLGRIVRLIRQPAGFATLSLDGDDVAWGLAVAERGYVGLYDIVVAPNLRGLGVGRRLVTSLLAWGRRQGATRAYLQVREANEVAGALYRSLGFEIVYRYTHRIQPPRAAP